MDYEWTTVFWIASSRYIEKAFYRKSGSRLDFIGRSVWRIRETPFHPVEG
jgi:hypothetical protein